MNIGVVIKEHRRINELTVRVMAKEIGVSHGTISRLERGFPVDAATMLKLINWLFTPDQKGPHEPNT